MFILPGLLRKFCIKTKFPFSPPTFYAKFAQLFLEIGYFYCFKSYWSAGLRPTGPLLLVWLLLLLLLLLSFQHYPSYNIKHTIFILLVQSRQYWINPSKDVQGLMNMKSLRIVVPPPVLSLACYIISVLVYIYPLW